CPPRRCLRRARMFWLLQRQEIHRSWRASPAFAAASLDLWETMVQSAWLIRIAGVEGRDEGLENSPYQVFGVGSGNRVGHLLAIGHIGQRETLISQKTQGIAQRSDLVNFGENPAGGPDRGELLHRLGQALRAAGRGQYQIGL